MNLTSPCAKLRFLIVPRARVWLVCRLEVRHAPGTGQVYAR